jgi:two-component system, NtrC family, sensor histidine kinase AtoS
VIAGLGTPPAKPMMDIVKLLASVINSIFENSASDETIGNELKLQSQIASRLSIIAEYVQEGVLQLSPELRIRAINPRLEEILGFSNREIEGQDVGKILIGNDKLPQSLLQVQTIKSAINIGDVRLFRRDGHPFQAQIRISPAIINEQLDEIEIFIQDMTEKEQIRAHAQELENRAWLGELMAVFAHEVRNPINNISTGLQLMSMHSTSNDTQQVAIGRMLQDCDRLEQLVKSVLGFSKPIEYQMESLDLGVLLQRLFDRQRLKLSNPRIRLELQIDPKCPMVSGHMRSLEQVFNNLVSNAIQAMGEDEGVITIKLASGTMIEGIPYVDIFVADNGPGIPKDVQDKIFQPFLTTKQNGTGLGLSIAKRIITSHKGNIQLSSFPGGTIFHIQLPTAADETRES